MLNFFFFQELGFHGERSGGDWADAGCLHRVIERRAGIALSLSILYMEIGRAIGLKLVALEFPDSFLVKLVCTGRVLVIDVSDRGATLSVQQLQSRLASTCGDADADEGCGALQRLLRGVPEDDIPVRILRALRLRHQAAGRWPKRSPFSRSWLSCGRASASSCSIVPACTSGWIALAQPRSICWVSASGSEHTGRRLDPAAWARLQSRPAA